MIKAILVSYNRHKFYEYQQMIKDVPFELVPLDPSFKGLLSEDGKTFEANAIQKVTAIEAPEHTVLFAEDSGLMIDALNGEPGVHSRRFSGLDSDAANNQKVLELMKNESQRSARFVAVIAYLDPARKLHLFKGECEGLIHSKAEGSEGFGYDPIFIPRGQSQTFAELGPLYKNQHSHRHQAFLKLKKHLKDER